MPRRIATCMLATLVLSFAAGSPARAEGPSQHTVERKAAKEIQDLMSEQEFKQAGLDKLSPGELETLNRWLYGYVEVERQVAADKAVDEALPKGEKAFGIETVPEVAASVFRDTPPNIRSRVLDEDFRGWSGKTLFRLENGQVWRQSEPGRFFYPKRNESPILEIKRGMFGSYLLSVEGMGSSVRVERVE